jgi:hypothetical protein
VCSVFLHHTHTLPAEIKKNISVPQTFSCGRGDKTEEREEIKPGQRRERRD